MRWMARASSWRPAPVSLDLELCEIATGHEKPGGGKGLLIESPILNERPAVELSGRASSLRIDATHRDGARD